VHPASCIRQKVAIAFLRLRSVRRGYCPTFYHGFLARWATPGRRLIGIARIALPVSERLGSDTSCLPKATDVHSIFLLNHMETVA